jgi:flagellar basal-body rod modification protein FlgD
MSTINPVSSNSYESLGLSTKKEPEKAASTEDEFLTLMLAQLKNQDPTEPMDNGAFLAQLAQINTASGIEGLQSSFSNFSASMQSNQALQASGLVGRSVSVPGPEVMLNSGSSVEGGVMLSTSTSELQLSVYDGRGQLVRNIGMGTQTAGDIPFNWNGLANDGTPLPSGVYTIKAEAMVDGSLTAMGTKAYATVESVSMASGSQGIQLNLAGIGTVPFSNVQQVR